MQDKFNRFMAGRYGMDELNRFLLGTVFGLLIVNLFLRMRVLSLVVMILLVVCYVRMLSRDFAKRREENGKFLVLWQKAAGLFRKEKGKAQDLKQNHIYRCPGCKQKIRVPRGKGKIVITCPKCKTEFTRKS